VVRIYSLILRAFSLILDSLDKTKFTHERPVTYFPLFLACLAALTCVPSLAHAQAQNNPTSRVYQSASELDYPPFAIVKEDGSADGFSVELLKATMKAVGLKVNIIVGPWHENKQKLADGEIDLLPLVAKTPQRDEIYDFTSSYMTMHGAIFVREGDDRIKNAADLHDKEVLVMRGDSAHEYVVREKLASNIILKDSFGEALRQLSSGKGDVDINQSEHSDYRFRLFIKKDQWVTVISELADEQDYENFKNEVARYQSTGGTGNIECLHRIWSIMYEYQNNRRAN